jgi:hypothetical protein
MQTRCQKQIFHISVRPCAIVSISITGVKPFGRLKLPDVFSDIRLYFSSMDELTYCSSAIHVGDSHTRLCYFRCTQFAMSHACAMVSNATDMAQWRSCMHSKAIQCSFRESQASCSSYLYIQLVFDLENIGHTHLPSVIHPTYS